MIIEQTLAHLQLKFKTLILILPQQLTHVATDIAAINGTSNGILFARG